MLLPEGPEVGDPQATLYYFVHCAEEWVIFETITFVFLFFLTELTCY